MLPVTLQASIRQYPEIPETLGIHLQCHIYNPHTPGWVTSEQKTMQISETIAPDFLSAPKCLHPMKGSAAEIDSIKQPYRSVFAGTCRYISHLIMVPQNSHAAGCFFRYCTMAACFNSSNSGCRHRMCIITARGHLRASSDNSGIETFDSGRSPISTTVTSWKFCSRPRQSGTSTEHYGRLSLVECDSLSHCPDDRSSRINVRNVSQWHHTTRCQVYRHLRRIPWHIELHAKRDACAIVHYWEPVSIHGSTRSVF